MLARPARGFQRSVSAHNVELAICCDWLEASVLFDDGEIGGADVVDFLRENEIYADQDFAWELVNDAFSNIRERSRLIGSSYPIELIGTTRLQQKGQWQLYPGYSFCLVLSLARCYPQWARAFGPDYTVQGELFEALTAEAVRASLSDWTVHPTGWTRTAPRRLGTIVADVAARLGETTGDIMRWSKQKANEAGLHNAYAVRSPDIHPRFAELSTFVRSPLIVATRHNLREHSHLAARVAPKRREDPRTRPAGNVPPTQVTKPFFTVDETCRRNG
jgi:hypothetical protein